MSDTVRLYVGKDIDVTYDAERCIHAAECTRGLPAVFNNSRRPWIEPNEASADAIAAVIAKCPSGALHFIRHDGGNPETPPEHDSVTVMRGGPLYIRALVQLRAADGSVIVEDTRLALCRCGQSHNKPFCDNGHLNVAFDDLRWSLAGTRDIMPAANSSGLGEMSTVIDRWKPGFLFRRVFRMRGPAPTTSGPGVRRTVKLKGILPDTTSWVRILEDGRIEVEYYDRSAGAEDHSRGDVAWMCRISASEQSHLYELLRKHTNATITDDRTMLDALVGTFEDAWAIRDWLKEGSVPFEGEFGSWP